jgi:hypothetical protein
VWGIGCQSHRISCCLKIFLYVPISIRHLNGLLSILVLNFRWEPSEMLDTHKASMRVVVPLTVGAEGCPIWSLKAPVAYHPYHIQWYSISSSGNLFCSSDRFPYCDYNLLGGGGRKLCGHSSLQCPASPHLKQIPSVFTAATNAWAMDVIWYDTVPISLVATIHLSWCSSQTGKQVWIQKLCLPMQWF